MVVPQERHEGLDFDLVDTKTKGKFHEVGNFLWDSMRTNSWEKCLWFLSYKPNKLHWKKAPMSS
jgi:hypothetical protein